MPLTNIPYLPPQTVPYYPIPQAPVPVPPYAPTFPRLPGAGWSYTPPAYQPIPSAYQPIPQFPSSTLPLVDQAATTIQRPAASISSQIASPSLPPVDQASTTVRSAPVGNASIPAASSATPPPAPSAATTIPASPQTALPPPPGALPPPPASRFGWATRDIAGSSKLAHGLSGIGTGIGANVALSTISDRDFDSSPLGRILGATRRGIGFGAFTGPVGGIVGGLGAGLGQAGLEAGQGVANTEVGKGLIERSDARANELAQMRESDNPLQKLYGWGQGVYEAVQPANQIGQALRLLGENDLEQTNVGNIGQGDPSQSPEAQQAQQQADARAEADRARQERIAAATPENLDATMSRLGVSDRARAEVTREMQTQNAVLDEMARAGALTVPRPVTERDGKMYVGDVEVPAEQVTTVKGPNGQDVKVVETQATQQDLEDMRVETYGRIVQSLPEVVEADRAEIEQMNRALGMSAALQTAMGPYAQQANALADTYAAQAGANPMIAPLADAFRTGQQGIANAYTAQAATLPYQVMLEQQAKAQQAQAEQQAMLERQIALEEYRRQHGYSSYQQDTSQDPAAALGLGG